MGIAAISWYRAICDSCGHSIEYKIVGSKYRGQPLLDAGWSTRPNDRYGETWHCPTCTKNNTPIRRHHV